LSAIAEYFSFFTYMSQMAGTHKPHAQLPHSLDSLPNSPTPHTLIQDNYKQHNLLATLTLVPGLKISGSKANL
jgi:hypothetical protein